MYCRYCGKQTENADGICDECRAESASTQAQDALQNGANGMPPYGMPNGVPPYAPYGMPNGVPPYAPYGMPNGVPPYDPYGMPNGVPPYEAPMPSDPNMPNPGYTKNYGFGGALTSLLVGCVSSVITYIAIILIAMYLAAYGYAETSIYIEEYMVEGFDVGGLVLTIIGTLASVVSLVFGIISIKKFADAKKYGVKPVATLVLGIIGVVASSSALFVAFIGFMCYAAIPML